MVFEKVKNVLWKKNRNRGEKPIEKQEIISSSILSFRFGRISNSILVCVREMLYFIMSSNSTRKKQVCNNCTLVWILYVYEIGRHCWQTFDDLLGNMGYDVKKDVQTFFWYASKKGLRTDSFVLVKYNHLFLKQIVQNTKL